MFRMWCLKVLISNFLLIVPSTAFLIDTNTPKALKVQSFNIQHFGRGKMANATLASQITQIVSRGDVSLIMETRDATGTALQDLWGKLNATGAAWGLVAGPAVGRSQTYKEQYVFFYKLSTAKLVDWWQIPDPSDVYEREPLAAAFTYLSAATGAEETVVLIGLHTRPQDTIAELAALPSDIRTASTHLPGGSKTGVVAMGDFNADCRYASATRLSGLEIFKSGGDFTSLITKDLDTTSGSSDCAYDRVVSYGGARASHATVYNYQSALGISEENALAISDHMPVEFLLD